MQIEKNIPIPDYPKITKTVPHGFWKAMVRDMEPGDSVLCPTYPKAVALAAQVAGVYGQGNQVIRSVEDGYRVWRVR